MDLLSDILSRLQLAGTLYFRTSFTSPWSIEVPSYQNVARFHFAHRGRCFVRVAGAADPVQLEQGDLIVIMRGAGHTLFCDPQTEKLAVQLDTVVEQSGFNGSGTLVWGDESADQETQLVCGHFAFEKDARHPLLEALPAHIHIRNYGSVAGNWMENTLRLIGAEAGTGGMGGDIIATKLSEIIFAQALRTFLSGEGGNKPVLAGFADIAIAVALEAFHKDPAHKWTLANLSKLAGLSRTAFALRFAQTMSNTPMGYITQWRMQIARQELAASALPIIDIAEQAGYQSEAAFGRVFKKHLGSSPARYRKQARASS